MKRAGFQTEQQEQRNELGLQWGRKSHVLVGRESEDPRNQRPRCRWMAVESLQAGL